MVKRKPHGCQINHNQKGQHFCRQKLKMPPHQLMLFSFRLYVKLPNVNDPQVHVSELKWKCGYSTSKGQTRGIEVLTVSQQSVTLTQQQMPNDSILQCSRCSSNHWHCQSQRQSLVVMLTKPSLFLFNNLPVPVCNTNICTGLPR